MIVGACAPGKSPYITGIVYFPNPVDISIEVPFLVDTGAEWTTISGLDLIKLGDRLPQLRTTSSPVEVRVASGGGFRQGVAYCGIAFVHDDQSVSTFAVNAGTAPNAAALGGIPSLLGMDVISHGALRVLAQERRVEFDPPSGDLINVAPPWNSAAP